MFQTLVEYSEDVIALHDKKGHIYYVNPAIEKVTGYTPEEYCNRNGFDIMHPEDVAASSEKLAYVAQIPGGKVTIECRARRKDGVWCWIEGNITNISDGPLAGYMISYFRDVTTRKQGEAEREALVTQLQTTNARLSRVINSNIIGVMFSSMEGQITNANDLFLQMVGYTRADLEAGLLRWDTMTPPEYQEQDAVALEDLRINRSASHVFEKEFFRKDGSRVPVLVGAALFESSSVEGVAFVLDITQQKELERRKDDFISMASHELKTPVTSIKAFTQVLTVRSQKQNDEQALRFLSRMDAQLNKLTKLISDLLDITKIQTGELVYRQSVFDLDVLVTEIAENIQGTTQTHQILLDCQQGVQVYGDKDRIGQVLINLLTNAIKYSANTDKIIIRLSQDEQFAIVSVQDFGLGIDVLHQPRIFERFYQVTDPLEKTFPGLGIGLYISHEIMKRHNGALTVESQKGKGSTFSFRLPLKGQ